MIMQKQFEIMAMNNPFRSLKDEVSFLKETGVDAMELTIEPPESYFAQIEENAEILKGFCSIGHTRIDLEFANKNRAIRLNAIKKFEQALDLFASLDIHLVNFHPHRGDIGTPDRLIKELNIESLKTACEIAKGKNITIMIENQNPFPFPKDYEQIFSEVPDAMLLFDIAHAFYLSGEEGVLYFINNFSEKIRHVHLCDNRGTDDDHLFLGKGKINFKRFITEVVKKIDHPIAFSLEPFMVSDNPDGLRFASQSERNLLLSESINIVRNALPQD